MTMQQVGSGRDSKSFRVVIEGCCVPRVASVDNKCRRDKERLPTRANTYTDDLRRQQRHAMLPPPLPPWRLHLVPLLLKLPAKTSRSNRIACLRVVIPIVGRGTGSLGDQPCGTVNDLLGKTDVIILAAPFLNKH
eukprot:scaffold87455_cov28-Tisochrysis_lutea.AAC.2